MLTTSAALQTKLSVLSSLAAADDLPGFVGALVPLDLTAEEQAEYQQSLVKEPEEWAFLKADLQCIASGHGVTSIEGDQTTKAVFTFSNPLQGENVDRQVSFVYAAAPGEGGAFDWRAEG